MFFLNFMAYFWAAIDTVCIDTVQVQQKNDFPDEIYFVDLNKRMGKSIYISGPGQIWVCTDYIDFAEEN